MPIEKITILGERNSGTNFLQYALLENFKLDYIRGPEQKHFFGFTEPLNDDNLLTICIFRHPVDWIDSYFKRLHFVPQDNRQNIQSFITNEFYSVRDDENQIKIKGYEIMEDRNYATGERYKNIFELRKMKNDYLLNIIPQKVKNFYMIKYEDLRDDYENTLNKLKEQFNLIRHDNNGEYKQIKNYKGTYIALYNLKPILLIDEIKKLILESVDKEQEKQIGYDIQLN
jgi:hypothetical protein